MGKHSVRKSHRRVSRRASRSMSRRASRLFKRMFKKSRKGSRRHRKSFFKRMFSKSKKGSRKGHRKRFLSRRKSRFGHGVSANMPITAKMMGNFSPAEMNTFQQYTGMGAYQSNNHLNDIPLELRSNFYSNV